MPELGVEEREYVLAVRDWVRREVRPVVRELEHANTYPEQLIDGMKRLGVFGLAVPEEFGGAPVSMPCYAQVTEELARGWMSLAGAMGGHTVVAKLLTMFGTDEQRKAHLPAMATGELRATMALTCRRSRPWPGARATTMSSTVRRPGSATRAARALSPCSSRPIRRPSRGTGG